MSIYLDNAATTQVCPEAADMAYKMMREDYGNPSSTHTLGRRAKAALDEARKNVAAGLGCAPGEVYFTSCGTESDNWAIMEGAYMQRRKGKHIISSMTEHDAVLRALERLQKDGWEVTLLPPDETGAVSVEAVRAALREDTVLVSLMLVNNETGSITDIAAIAKMLRASGSKALLHTDAVQGFMKIPFTARSLGADMISVSGHKIHAPKGIGALYIRKGLNLPAHILGGGQEGGLRSGTENLPQITAFGEAARLAKAALPEAGERMRQLREYCVETLTEGIPGAVVIGGGAPHILSLGIPGARSEVMMSALEAKEIYLSKSSACKRGKRSHVLEAMGVPDKVIDGALRISFSRFTTQEDCEIFCRELIEVKNTYFPAR